MRRWMCLALVVLPAAAPAAQLDADAIIERSVTVLKADWKAAPAYSHSETVRENGGTRTYNVTMIAGSPYRRLVAVDGKPLSPEEDAEQKQKLADAVTERRDESPRQKAERIKAYETGRTRDHAMMEEIPRAFDFALLGERKLGGREVYLLRATPRPGYQPPNAETRALTGMQGKLWIDKATFQWVKVEAQVVRPVSIEGFLARVEPGTFFELEKMPVEGGYWMPKHFIMKSRSKILFVFTHKTHEDETYFNYHREST